MASLTPVIQPRENDSLRSSGRVRRKIQVDSRCKCGTEITAEEKDVGECVMMCKARGCETIWVREFCSSSKVDADLPILVVSHCLHGL